MSTNIAHLDSCSSPRHKNAANVEMRSDTITDAIRVSLTAITILPLVGTSSVVLMPSICAVPLL